MKNLFIWEIKKNVKKNALIGIGVAMIALLVLFAIAYNSISDLFQGLQGGMDGPVRPEESPLTKEEIMQYIASGEKQLTELDEREKKGENVYSARFEVKSKIISLKYALEHGYYDKPVKIAGFNFDTMSLSAEGFTVIYVSIVTIIVLIYGVILGASMYCNEYKSGTIKLVMTRPVTKTSVTAAKLLSMYAVLAAMFFIPALIGFTYGGIAFGSKASTKIISSFNATTASMTTLGAITFGMIMNNFINVLVMATVSFGLATVTRSLTAGIVPSIVIMFNVGNFLGQTGISAFLLSTSLDFSVYFGINEVPRNGNFFISLAIVLFWWTISIVAAFVVTNKRDVY